jgi:UDP-N-acetylmuramoylalanine--D-glutamate ligase
LRSAGLRGHAAGNIGIPLITFVARSTPEDIYSTELSSFQLESIQNFHPTVACLLNLSPDHLDRYRAFEDYVAAKRRLFMNQKASDTAVLNADDGWSAETAGMIRSESMYFSRKREPERGAFVRGEQLLYRDDRGDRELFSAQDIQLKGSHNLENVLAASTIAIAAGASLENMRETVRAFRGVEHRLEWVAEIGGVQYFNDSKATNVDATLKSLDAFARGIHLIAGGRDKGGDFSLLQPLVEERVKHLVVLGEAAGAISEALAGTVDTQSVSSLHEAVALCRQRAVPGDIVLLAPACASFDMFENYEHRGREFKGIVRGLLEG